MTKPQWALAAGICGLLFAAWLAFPAEVPIQRWAQTIAVAASWALLFLRPALGLLRGARPEPGVADPAPPPVYERQKEAPCFPVRPKQRFHLPPEGMPDYSEQLQTIRRRLAALETAAKLPSQHDAMHSSYASFRVDQVAESADAGFRPVRICGDPMAGTAVTDAMNIAGLGDYLPPVGWDGTVLFMHERKPKVAEE